MISNEVRFGSITTVPMDFECGDGSLARAVNVVNETGTLTAVLPPRELFRIGAEDRIVCIHTVGSGDRHFVVLMAYDDEEGHQRVLGYMTEGSPGLFNAISWDVGPDAEVYRATALGNTLVVLTSEGLRYFLFRDGAYVALGSQPPLPELAFFLEGSVQDDGEGNSTGVVETPNIGNVNLELPESVNINARFSEANKAKINSVFWANLNKGIADSITDEGLFTFPFFVRYGLRMYDGSVTMISSPVLIRSCYGPNIIPIVPYPFGNDEWTYTGIYAVAGKLMASSAGTASENRAVFESLRSWKDIVLSLDVFVSAPIYTYDSNVEIERFGSGQKSDTTSLMAYGGSSGSLTAGNDLIAQGGYILEMPYYGDAEMEENLRQENLFYLLKSIPLDELTVYDVLYTTDLTPEKGYLSSLRSRERLPDDYNSRDKLFAKGVFGYNARLNLVDLEREPYAGNELRSTVRVIISGEPLRLTAYTCMKIDQQPLWLKGPSIDAGTDFNVPYFFHPSTDATALLITATPQGAQSPDRYVRFPLEESPVLNGAVYVAPFGRRRISWSAMDEVASGIVAGAQESARIEVYNKIYTSEVNNPFVFGRGGITTVGSGHIKGVSAAAKALSQGQFGQFPLYAFTDEGVWALSVSETGTYSARQPITRDVCTEPDAITQLDSSVMFVSARGVMLLSGSECECVSEAVNRPPGEDDLFDVRTAKGILYDYVNQRVLLFRPDCAYSWVYSLRTGGWFLCDTAFEYALNSYPDAIAVCVADGQGHSVVCTERVFDGGEDVRFELVSRPVKLDSYGYKTLNGVICRGTFGAARFRIEVEGSRSPGSWHRIGSAAAASRILHMHGTPYRYFRIRLSGRLGAGESLMGVSMLFTPRFSRKS